MDSKRREAQRIARLAQAIVEKLSDTVYAAPEWETLSQDGQTWVCAIVSEALLSVKEDEGCPPSSHSLVIGNSEPPQPQSDRCTATERQAKAAFEEFANQYDHDSDEWLDMDVGELFKAGFFAARQPQSFGLTGPAHPVERERGEA